MCVNFRGTIPSDEAPSLILTDTCTSLRLKKWAFGDKKVCYCRNVKAAGSTCSIPHSQVELWHRCVFWWFCFTWGGLCVKLPPKSPTVLNIPSLKIDIASTIGAILFLQRRNTASFKIVVGRNTTRRNWCKCRLQLKQLSRLWQTKAALLSLCSQSPPSSLTADEPNLTQNKLSYSQFAQFNLN